MSVLYTLVLAQQQVQPLDNSPKARAITWLCFSFGILFLLFGLWFTRPKKTGHQATKKSSPFGFEWIPVAFDQIRHNKGQSDAKDGPSPSHPSCHNPPHAFMGEGSDGSSE